MDASSVLSSAISPPRKVIFSLSASISQDLLRVGASGALIHKLKFQSGYLKLWIFTMAPVQFLLGGSNTGHLWDVYPGESWHSLSALSPNLYLRERPFESDRMIPHCDTEKPSREQHHITNDSMECVVWIPAVSSPKQGSHFISLSLSVHAGSPWCWIWDGDQNEMDLLGYRTHYLDQHW